jgi:hypothetical protein
MGNEYPEHELREFIYLNDESINSHLSSLGVGLETGRRLASSDESEISSRFAALVPSPIGGFGGSGGTRDVESQETEHEMDITAPYRFQELIRQVKNGYEIKLPEKEDVDVEYGDVIAVEGVVSPLSAFRLEIAQDSALTLQHSTIAAEKQMVKLREVLEKHGMEQELGEIERNQEEEMNTVTPVEVREARSDVTEIFVGITKGLTGGRVPIRADSRRGFGGNSYGAVLDRDQLRVPVERAFYKPRKYTIFGRVEDNISESEVWDPLDTTRVLQSFASEDVGVNHFMDVIHQISKENQIEMLDEHMMIEGPATIIDPIAVYW